MVVITIFAVISAIAVPAYQEYTARARLLQVAKLLDGLLEQARQAAVNGTTIPSTINDLVSGTAVAYTTSPLIDAVYYDDGSSWANSGKAAMMQAIISAAAGGSFEGFSAGDSGTSNRLTVAFVINNGNLQTFCGNWEDSSSDVPVKYLPEGCNAVGFATEVEG